MQDSIMQAAGSLCMQMMQVTASARRNTYDKQGKHCRCQDTKCHDMRKLKVLSTLLCIQRNMVINMAF